MKGLPECGATKPLYSSGLCAIFLVLMFSMVGISTLFALQIMYCIQILHLPDSQATLLFATSIALLFTMPVIGSYIALHWLNIISTIAIGLLLCIAGLYFICVTDPQYFYIGLATFITGNGCVLPNVVALLSRLFNKTDQRRDRAFLICFTGMNIGSFIALVCLTLVAINWGYHFAFLTCAYLFVVALFIFISSAYKLQPINNKKRAPLATPVSYAYSIGGLLVAIVLLSLFLHYAINHPSSLLIVGLIAISFMAITLYKLAMISKKTLMVGMFLLGTSITFWAFFLLAPSLVTLYIERTQHHAIFNYTIPSSAFFALNPLFVIVGGVIYGLILRWRRRQQSKTPPWSAVPFLTGLGLLSLAYLVMSIVYYSSINCFIQIAGFYGLLSVAELLIFPLGASVISRLLPHGQEGLLTGIWLSSISVGSIISGVIARMVLNTTDTNLPHSVGTNYSIHFLHFSLIIAAVASILTLLYHMGQRNTLTTQDSSSSTSSSATS